MVVPIVVIWHEFGNKYSGRSDQYNFPSYESLQEGRVELKVLELLIGSGLIYGLCYITNVLGKCYIAHVSKTLNNSKVEFLSKMMSKDININLHH